jgi:hypothetical protein
MAAFGHERQAGGLVHLLVVVAAADPAPLSEEDPTA